MIKTASRLIDAEAFQSIPDPSNGVRQELIAGKVVTMPPPSFRHGEALLSIGAILQAFIRKHRLGRIVTESGVITERDPDSVRGPDIAYWSKERLPLGVAVDGYPEVAADIVVEIISESKRRRAVKRKLKEYFSCGIRLVCVVDLEERTLTIYDNPKKGQLFENDAVVEGGDVLPGFRCSVGEFFA